MIIRLVIKSYESRTGWKNVEVGKAPRTLWNEGQMKVVVGLYVAMWMGKMGCDDWSLKPQYL
jgi:hypothetical protein